MDPHQYRSFLLIITAVLALFIASPALQQLVVFPQTDFFTELSMYGPYHNATYPANITANENYRLYLDVTNHVGVASYYVAEVKFRNETQSAPDSFNHTNSVLQPLASLTFFVADNRSLELPVDVSFQYSLDPANASKLNMQTVTVNGAPLDVSTTSIVLDTAKNGFYGNLFFELWLYNGTTSTLEYNQRYVSLWLRLNP